MANFVNPNQGPFVRVGTVTRYTGPNGFDFTPQITNYLNYLPTVQRGLLNNSGLSYNNSFPGRTFSFNNGFLYNSGTDSTGRLIPQYFGNRFHGVIPYRSGLAPINHDLNNPFTPDILTATGAARTQAHTRAIQELDLRPIIENGAHKADEMGRALYTRAGYRGVYTARFDGGIEYDGSNHSSGVPLRPQTYYVNPNGPGGIWYARVPERFQAPQPTPPPAVTIPPPRPVPPPVIPPPRPMQGITRQPPKPTLQPGGPVQVDPPPQPRLQGFIIRQNNPN